MIHVTISPGNSKLGAKIPNTSLPPGKTCAPGVPCFKSGKCYARKAYRMYPSARKAWDNNLKLLRKDPVRYMQEIMDYCDAKHPKRFRIHVAGDFVNQTHVYMWIRIAANAPLTKFVAFTKRYELDFSQAPSNLRINIGRWPGWPCNLDPKTHVFAWMEDPKFMDVYIPKDARRCKGGKNACAKCSLCWSMKDGESVMFHAH